MPLLPTSAAALEEDKMRSTSIHARALAISLAIAAFAAMSFGQAEQTPSAPPQNFDIVVRLIAPGANSGDILSVLKSPKKSLPVVGTFWMRGGVGEGIDYESVWAGGPKDPAKNVSYFRIWISEISSVGNRVVLRNATTTITSPINDSGSIPAALQRLKASANRISLEMNVPTVLASFESAGTDGPLLVVITARRAEK